MKLKTLFHIGMISALLLAIGAACSSGDDGDNGGSSPTPSETSTPRISRAADLPDGFPAEFPLYAGAAYEQGVRYEEQVLALFTSPDARNVIADFYREQLQTEPWTLVSEVEGSGGRTLLMTFLRDADNLRGTLTLAAGSPGAGTTISVIFALPGFGLSTPTETPTPEPSESQ